MLVYEFTTAWNPPAMGRRFQPLNSSTLEKIGVAILLVILTSFVILSFTRNDPIPTLTATYVIATVLLAGLSYATASLARKQLEAAHAAVRQSLLARIDATAPTVSIRLADVQVRIEPHGVVHPGQRLAVASDTSVRFDIVIELENHGESPAFVTLDKPWFGAYDEQATHPLPPRLSAPLFSPPNSPPNVTRHRVGGDLPTAEALSNSRDGIAGWRLDIPVTVRNFAGTVIDRIEVGFNYFPFKRQPDGKWAWDGPPIEEYGNYGKLTKREYSTAVLTGN